LAALLWPWPAAADHPTPLDHLLRQAQEAQEREAATRRAREARFLAEHADQKRLLAEARQKLAAERARGKKLKAAFERNEAELAKLETELKQSMGDLGELFGTVRQSAKDLTAFVEESLVSAQYSERAGWFRVLGESKKLPDITELERFWIMIQQEIIESGRVVRFLATVIGTDGVSGKRDVTRIGLFNAIAGDDYLKFLPEVNRFTVLARQPSASDRALAADLAGARDGYPEMALDPTRGVLLGLLVETPDLEERVEQGGIIGYVIIALGALGLFIVFVRLGYLTVIGRRMQDQLQDPATPSSDNPLGRVLAVAAAVPESDTKNLELQIDEAILRETPRLRRGEAIVKLLAGVAPLLGLLGTVVGMIVTFQSISLFGTGDPKLMASGISQALVTTALGLIVAIPLLFLHSLVATRSRALVHVLDEQSAGVIAMRQEQS